jgi:hypothetical protein
VSYVDPSGHAAFIDVGASLLQNPYRDDIFVGDVAGSGLYALIARASVGGASATRRLGAILGQTAGVGIPLARLDKLVGGDLHTHFRGLGSTKGDTGFAPEFRDEHLYADLWGKESPASKQTGHFLTAVSMGAVGGSLFERLVIGHEIRADSPPQQFAMQIGTPRGADFLLFREALRQDEGGNSVARDRALYGILDPSIHGLLSSRQGNSMEDLRLSVRGWRLGGMVASGAIQTNKQLAAWIALNVAGD